MNKLSDAYDCVLGGVIAISPELYKLALNKIANLIGRPNDESFRADIAEYEKTLPCYID